MRRFSKIKDDQDIGCPWLFGNICIWVTVIFGYCSLFDSPNIYLVHNKYRSPSYFGSTLVSSTHWFSELTIGTPRFLVHIKHRRRHDFWSSLNFGTPHISLAPVRQHISYTVAFLLHYAMSSLLCYTRPPPDGFLSGRLPCERARQVQAVGIQTHTQTWRCLYRSQPSYWW